MKIDRFFLMIGVVELALGINFLYRADYLFAVIMFILAVIVITKDSLNLWKFSWQK